MRTFKTKSKFIGRALAVFTAAAMVLNMCAFAEQPETTIIDAGDKPETTVIDAGDKTETTVIDAGDKPETVIIDDGEESHLPESGIDLSDIEYTQADLSDYIEWDGKTKLSAGKSYYITKKTAPRADFTIPTGAKLLVREGAELVLYKGKMLHVLGSLVVEPNAKLTLSGTFTAYGGSGVEIYGSVVSTKSSLVRIASEFVIRSSGRGIFSGTTNVHNNGLFLGYGTATFSASSRTVVTGQFQIPENAKLYMKGYLGVTINGKGTAAGYFSLSGEFVNSGVFIFESTAKFYKTASARFAVSKSSRLIDYREGSGSFGKPAVPGSSVSKKGIDVSYAQGAVDWAEVRASGIEFAMIRASRGAVSDKKPMAKDVTFDYNITQAQLCGINVGVYHYLYATTVEEAREEAKFFLSVIEPYKITYPVVLDIEEEYQAALGIEAVTAIARAFLDEVSAAGYYAMIYANKAWLTTRLDMRLLSDYDVWLAQWHTVPTYTGSFGMWQYSSKGIVSGINGYVDLNISYKDYAKIIREGKYNNLS
ncbi:MAG: glycoside hydrolase family 25 protein [Oscillospiraceae bacterium]|nr:glycoside hydrolase family 25 protein [Oscillospiraceae bacterium]